MSLDSIHKKKTNPHLRNQLKNPKIFIIPIIIIVALIAIAWAYVLKHNFSRIDEKSKNEPDPTAEEVNTTIENLTKNLDKLKDQKIFSQPKDSTNTITGIKEEAELPGSTQTPFDEPMPAQQY